MSQPETPDQTALEKLTAEIRRFNNHRFVRIQNKPWQMVFFQFARGLAFGLGSALGATVLLSLLVWWISQFEFLPILGEWAVELNRMIQQPE